VFFEIIKQRMSILDMLKITFSQPPCFHQQASKGARGKTEKKGPNNN
jgi:hypothetical protein